MFYKTLFTILFSLLIINVTFALPIECRSTNQECRTDRWNTVPGLDCYALDNPYWSDQYGTDPAECTAKVMFEYERSERIKVAPTEAAKDALRNVTKVSDFAYDIRFDYATSTPLGGMSQPEQQEELSAIQRIINSISETIKRIMEAIKRLL